MGDRLGIPSAVDFFLGGGLMTTQFYYNFNLINIILYYNHYIDLLHLSCNIIFEGGFNLLGRGGGGFNDNTY